MSDESNDNSVALAEEQGAWAVKVMVNGTEQVPRFFGDKADAVRVLGRLSRYEQEMKLSA